MMGYLGSSELSLELGKLCLDLRLALLRLLQSCRIALWSGLGWLRGLGFEAADVGVAFEERVCLSAT
jgi:hypothetical protein